jgi:hypothetical protein
VDADRPIQGARNCDWAAVEGYAGEYHVRYFFDSGEFSDEYDLIIEKIDNVYRAFWLVDGETGAIGIGMEVQSGLAIGWRRVTD